MYDEMAELEAAAEWANKLLNYACASNRNTLINEYPRYLPSLLRVAQRLLAQEEKQPR